MNQLNSDADDPRGTVSIEKALLADLCLGYPLGRLVFGPLAYTPLSSDTKPPSTYLFRGEQLAALKQAAKNGQEQATTALDALSAAAAKAMESAPPSVTDKPVSRHSADPRDYQSIAKYFWPNHSAPHKEWARHDGNVNPECYSPDYDYLRLVQFAEDVTLLSVSAYLTDNAEQGQHAALMLQHWFINPSTRQNPHFKFAQIASSPKNMPPGGRWPGVIEARFLIYVTEAVRLLESSGFLPQPIAAELRQWFGELLDWMLQSEPGQRAAKARNNIALWHSLQCMVYADFCGKSELAASCLHERVMPQIEQQIDPDGSLPSELDRAYPQDYVVFSIAAMALISRAGEHHGLALWDQKRADGRNFQAPHDWLLRVTHSPELLNRLNSAEAQEGADSLGHALDTALQLRALERVVHTFKGAGQELVRLRKELDTLRSKHDSLHARHKRETAHLKSEISTFKQTQHALTRYLNRLESLADSLLTSRSWRLTRPLRTALRLLLRQDRVESLKDFIGPRPPLPASTRSAPTQSAHEKQAAPPTPLTPAVTVKKARQAIGKLIRRSPEEYLELLRKASPANEQALQAEYHEKGLDQQPDTFVLYRIIGNDLYPRHRIGQSRDNLRFVLENEPQLENCEKRWVVNRIVDAEEERQIIELLTAHRQEYIHIPFVAEDYRLIDWDFDTLPTPNFLDSEAFRKLSSEEQERARVALYRLKNLYVMNNNGARNTALRDGRDRAKWVLPWDGNCFITTNAWHDIVTDVTARPHLKYFAVPMERMLDNADLLRDDYSPNPVEEPQLLFRNDAVEEFNDAFPYGRRPKVELFWRLGIPGMWDNWRDDSWDPPRRPPSPEVHQFGCAGWVARMFSGQSEQESSDGSGRKSRLLARRGAILTFIDALDGTSNPLSTPAQATVSALSSIEQTSVIYASRRDGLGERLNAIVNAATIAKITGAPFRFTWEEMNIHVRNNHAINEVQEVFSDEFIKSHHASTAETENLYSLSIPRKSWAETRSILFHELREGSKIAAQSPPLINVLKESHQFRQKLSDSVWSSIRFAEPIEKIREEILTQLNFPKDAIAIHMRAGDIIYGHHSKSPRWVNKVICAPMAKILALLLQERGHTIILFGQEPLTAQKLANHYGCRISEEFYPAPPQNDMEAAFSDIFLMSRCTSIFAGNSGFAKIASQIKQAKLRDPTSVLPPEKWPQKIHAEVSANPNLYSAEQRAFAYLICINFCLKTRSTEHLAEYAHLAKLHNPENSMYALLEALVPLHLDCKENSDKLLESYYRDCELSSPREFSRSPHIRTLLASDAGTRSGLAFSRFIPKDEVAINSSRHRYLAATLQFLERQCCPKSIELLRTDLLAATAHSAMSSAD